LTVPPKSGWLPVVAIGAVHREKPFARRHKGKSRNNAQPPHHHPRAQKKAKKDNDDSFRPLKDSGLARNAGPFGARPHIAYHL